MNKQRKKQAFTLVELIVVITILAILGTIAFVSLQGYSKDARNSTRAADINMIELSLELHMLQTGKYPVPSDGSGETLMTVGTVGNSVITIVDKLSKIPLDPKSGVEYVYSTNIPRKEYSLQTNLEDGGNLVQVGVLNQVQAANGTVPMVGGNYNELYTITSTGVYVAIPSLLPNDVNNPTKFTINGEEIIYSPVFLGGKPTTSTGYLVFAQALQNAYTGSIFENKGVYSNLRAITGEADLQSYVKASFGLLGKNDTGASNTQIVLSCDNTTKPTDNGNISFVIAPTSINQAYVKDSLGCGFTCINGYSGNDCSIAPTGWMLKDPNCNIPDIIIGSQTWAGCNSTLGNGSEWGQSDGDIGTSNYSSSIGGCFEFSGTAATSCIKGAANMLSSAKESNWFTGSNANGDFAVNNIWGKFYKWSDSTGACATGRHVPSDGEWGALEAYLKGSDCRTGNESNQASLCQPIGWFGHSGLTASNNIVNALQIPLSGRRTDGNGYSLDRGSSARLWTSTTLTSNPVRARDRYLAWSIDGVARHQADKTSNMSVRCIKGY